MKKRAAAASIAILALGLVGITALPANAGNTDWSNFANSVTSSGISGAGYGGTPNIQGYTTDSTLTVAVTGAQKSFNFNGSPGGSITSAFAGPMINVPAGKTLQITGNGNVLTMDAAAGQPLFTGGGTVNLDNITLVTSSTVASGTVTLNIHTSASVESNGSLMSGTSTVNLAGTLSGTGSTTVPAGGTFVTGGPALVTNSGGIDVFGTFTNHAATTIYSLTVESSGVVNATAELGVTTSLAVEYGGALSSSAAVSVGGITNQGSITMTGSTLSAQSFGNLGTVRTSGTVAVTPGTLTNSGSIITTGSGAVTGSVTGNSFDVSYAVTSPQTPIGNSRVYAATFADAEQALPVPSGEPVFTGWLSTAEVTGSTSLAAIAGVADAQGKRSVALSERNGTFGTGTPAVGSSFTGFTPPSGGTATFGYQWLDGSAPIAGATSATLNPVPGPAGHVLSLAVTVTYPSGYSAPTGTTTHAFATTAGTFTTQPPTVSGLAAAGSTLVADGSASFGPAADTVTYEWFRNVSGTYVSVGTGATYLLGTADVGKSVKAVVTGTKAGYATATAETVVGPVTTQPVVTLSPASVTEGGTVTITVPGLAPSTDYRVELHSAPVVLATPHTSPAGVLSGSVTIPVGTVTGAHTIVIYDPNGNPVTSTSLTVAARTGLASTGASVLTFAVVEGAMGVLAIGTLLLVLTTRRRRAQH